jgi:hypothetical protein
VLESASDIDGAAGTAVIPIHRGIVHGETIRLGVALLASVRFAALPVFLIGLWIGGWWLALFISALSGIALATSYVLAAFLPRRDAVRSQFIPVLGGSQLLRRGTGDHRQTYVR